VFAFPKRNAAAGVFIKQREDGLKGVAVAIIHKHPLLALHVLYVGGHTPVKDAIGHGTVKRGRTVVRCFHSGNGGMKLTGTTFAAGGGFTVGLSVFVGLVSIGLFLRRGLIRGMGLICCWKSQCLTVWKLFQIVFTLFQL